MKDLSIEDILTFWSRNLDLVAKSHMSSYPILGQDDEEATAMNISLSGA